MFRSLSLSLALLVSLPAWAGPETANESATQQTMGVTSRAYERMVDLIHRMYLRPEEVNAAALLHGAANYLADKIPWLLVEVEGEAVYLRHGSGAPIGSVSAAEISPLPQALLALEGLLLESGYPLGDLPLRIEMLQGATKPLDSYSKILAGEQLSRFDVRLKGTLVGVGATFTMRNNQFVVKSLVSDAPAQAAGLKVGDILERVDGVSTVNMPLREVTRRIRGPMSTVVELSVLRKGRELDIPIQRAKIVVPNVSHRVLDGNVGYIKIDHFSQKTNENLVRSLAELANANAIENGIVIDLRKNTGGSMKQAARAADHFVKEGLLLRTVGADGGRVQNLQGRMDAEEAEQDIGAPLIVLIDERTASGSEILAGALLQLERAALVGKRTYGKGTVQKIYTIGTGARLKLTVAEYILADNLRIALGGLVPDVAVADIVLSGSGVRYRGWSEFDAGQPWDAILPVVTERSSWRDQVHEPGDLRLELARRALLRTKKGDRASILKALEGQVQAMRSAQEAHLLDALASHQIDWSPNPKKTPLDAVPDVDVSLVATPVPEKENGYRVRVEVENLSETPIYQGLVQLSCTTFSAWDEVVVPLGLIEPGARAFGEVDVSLRPGLPHRKDMVSATLRTDGHNGLPVQSSLFEARTTPFPELSVEARLLGEGKDRRAEMVVSNKGTSTLEGLEVHFSHPGDVNVELLDRASRVAALPAGEEARFSLGLRVGDEIPDQIPLNLVIEADDYNGDLAKWPLSLPVDGAGISIEAPRIAVAEIPISAPVGVFEMPLRVTDEEAIDHVVVYANGRKVAWLNGGSPTLQSDVSVDLRAGLNRLVVLAEDNEGVKSRRSLRIWAEETASVDAISPQQDP